MSDSVTLGDLLREYEGDLDVLPAGDYEAEITNVKPRATDIVPTLRVTVGPDAGKKFMIGVISWNGNAVARAFTRMREVGLDKAFFQSIGAEQLPRNTVMELVAQALKGRVVKVTIGVEEPNQYHEDYRNKLEKFGGLVSAPAVQLQTGVPQVPVAQAPPVAPPVAAVTPVTPVTQAAPPVAVAPPGVQVVPGQPVTAVTPVIGVATPETAVAPVAPAQAPVVPTIAPVQVTAPAAAPAPLVASVVAPGEAVAPAAPVADAAGVQPGTVAVTDEPDF